ncbi:MAG: transglutaminase domain-containing protein [Thermoprotei archaeon]|nr:MAG: transglutaminase domain-containing protein [Thermoprotei archaeon]RLF20615.1 MAG: transglutaminase domain-containing protein [Thermoprotei archaeon]
MSIIAFLKQPIPDSIRELVDSGKLKEAEEAIKVALKRIRDPERRERLEYELFRINVLRGEYNLTVEEAFKKFKEEVPDITREEFKSLMNAGKFDYRIIDGEVRFFKFFVFNFFKLNKEWEKRRTKRDEKRERARRKLYEQQDRIIELGKEKEGYVMPVRFKVRHTIKLRAGAVPDGERVRIWIPIPRKCELQSNIRILGYSPSRPYIAHEEALQRTAYFEVYATKSGAEVWIEYEYVCKGFFVRVDPSRIEPYDENSDLYVRYTAEQPPHIEFTPYLESLAKEIVGDERNPYIKAQKIYKWIVKNITYNLPYEYALYDNIPEYVAKNRRGDCGMQALLFITLCRIVGVPARWQSSWYMNPISPSPHDWAQFYVEPYGWLYVDPSIGGSMPEDRKYFYFGNIDNFRMVANGDIMVQFDPPKRYFRSDSVDNQRGEVEWSGGNLYFDKWDFKLEILEYETI